MWRSAAEMTVGVCWALFGAVWVTSAGYNWWKAPRARVRGRFSYGWLLAGVAIWLVIRQLRTHTPWTGVLASAWLALLGAVVLVCATAFTVWARLELGTMWSSTAVVKQQHVLRTDGPYAIVRHPIYTGLIGMLLGTAIVNGLGLWLLLPLAGVLLFELKIRREERLMYTTFGAQYEQYRRRVPQLIPGLRMGRR